MTSLDSNNSDSISSKPKLTFPDTMSPAEGTQPRVPAQPAETPAQSAPTPNPQPISLQNSASNVQDQSCSGKKHVMASAKKSMPDGAKWAIAAMLLLLIVFGSFVMTSLNETRRETEMVNEIMKKAKALSDEGKIQNGIGLTEEELKATLKRATSTENNKQRPLLLKTIAFARAEDNYNANAIILDHITTTDCHENIRVEFFKVIMSRRKDIDNVAALLIFARNTGENASATQAIHAARMSAQGQSADEFIGDFLSLINNTNSTAVCSAAEKAAATLIAESENKSDFTAPIHGYYQSAVNDAAKFCMLRLLGSTGGEKAVEIVIGALNSDKATLQSAAIAALGIWANDSQFESLVEFIDECDDDQMRKNAYTAAYSFLRLDRNRDPEKLGNLWKSFAGTAKTQNEKMQIIRGMANQKHEWAIPLLEFFTDDHDDRIVDKAEQAKEHLKRRIRNAKQQ